MDESLSIAVDIVKIFAVIYGLIAISIFVYGVISVFSRKTRVFKDESSSYGFSKSLTVIDSVISKSFKPFYYHRIIPRDSEKLKGDSAVLVGWLYIILGFLMLSPLIWVFIKLK